jgi:hypothetical protein
MTDDRFSTRKFLQPIRAIDGPAFETPADARAYVLTLPIDKRTSEYWRRAAELLDSKPEGDTLVELEQQVRLALFYDGFTVTW